MGRKIINGIEVTTNLKRQRIQAKTNCQSTIINSAPTMYWQFEQMETDESILSVTGTHRLQPSSMGYGNLVNGVDDTNALTGTASNVSSGLSFTCAGAQDTGMYTTVIPEYSNSIPPTLTFEFFYTFEPVSSGLMRFGNLSENKSNGFEIIVQSIYEISEGNETYQELIGMMVIINTKVNGVSGSISEYIEDSDIESNVFQHIVLEVDSASNKLLLYKNKMVALDINIPMAVGVHNGNSCYLNVVEGVPPVPENGIFQSDNPPILPSASNWQDLYVATDRYEYENNTYLDFIEVEPGIYGNPIIGGRDMIVMNAGVDSLFAFDSEPDVVKFVFKYDDISQVDYYEIRIVYEYRTEYIEYSQWNLPFDPFEVEPNSYIGIQHEVDTFENGKIRAIVIPSSAYGSGVLLDIVFCSSGTRVYPYPMMGDIAPR